MEEFFAGSKIFELPHLIVVFITIISAVLLIFLTKKFAKTEKAQTYVIKITAAVILICAIISRFVYYDWIPTFLEFLPNTFCSTMGLVLPLAVIFCKKDSKFLFYALFAGTMGGLMTNLSGVKIGTEPLDNLIICYIYHGLMISISCLCWLVGYSKPTLDKVPTFVLGLTAMVTYGVFSNQVFGYENNMYLITPLIEDTIITWWFAGIVIISAACIFTIIYEACTKKWQNQTLFKIITSIKNLFCHKKNHINKKDA